MPEEVPVINQTLTLDSSWGMSRSMAIGSVFGGCGELSKTGNQRRFINRSSHFQRESNDRIRPTLGNNDLAQYISGKPVTALLPPFTASLP